ncbi:MAG: SAM-dependent methyltransferase [Gammaproteobacteria bacterium]|nr:SAM-dependent methyltransferase [Gammaproteobacteria bacterium]
MDKNIEVRSSLSASKLWPLQKQYYKKKGPKAWESEVPYSITNSAFIAQKYVQIIIDFIHTHWKTHPKQTNFQILELGSGVGKLAYLCMLALDEWKSSLPIKINLQYFMSDCTKDTLDYWRSHPDLQPFFEKSIAHALQVEFDYKQAISFKNEMGEWKPSAPLIVIANYFFDSIYHDAFIVKEKELYAQLITISNKDKVPDINNMQSLRFKFTSDKINASDYYQDKNLNDLLMHYQHKAPNNFPFLIPLGAIDIVNYLSNIDQPVLILSSDKGYNEIETMDYTKTFNIVLNGSLATCVNYHAISWYVNKLGGTSITPRVPLNHGRLLTCVFTLNNSTPYANNLTHQIQRHLNNSTLADYYLWISSVNNLAHATLSEIITILRTGHYDTKVFSNLYPLLISTLGKRKPEHMLILNECLQKIHSQIYFH